MSDIVCPQCGQAGQMAITARCLVPARWVDRELELIEAVTPWIGRASDPIESISPEELQGNLAACQALLRSAIVDEEYEFFCEACQDWSSSSEVVFGG